MMNIKLKIIVIGFLFLFLFLNVFGQKTELGYKTKNRKKSILICVKKFFGKRET